MPRISSKTAQRTEKGMLVCEAHGRCIQSSISRINGGNIISFKNLVTNFIRMVSQSGMPVRSGVFSINIQM
jgi:4-hydroxy-3-methylbut-2-en-1-yl diphosphate synthase IspG/GcpE